ncbi:MAG: hypothetical protein ACI9O8_001596, partial [Patiriisocius sp.]
GENILKILLFEKHVKYPRSIRFHNGQHPVLGIILCTGGLG